MYKVTPHISVRNLNVWFDSQHALKNVSVDIPRRCITAIVGPSGCGKTTLLRSLNRLVELGPKAKVSGQVLFDDMDIYDPDVDVTEIRSRIGLLAQKPFPLPMSIYDNVAYGPRIHGVSKSKLDDIVKSHLQAARLWDEVSDRLKAPATELSVGQQQRLCLARALAVEPDILLCDESTSALDPISARGIEDLLRTLTPGYTIVMVTHDLDQARRLADYAIFLWLGEVIEQGSASQLFDHPAEDFTRAYLEREVG
jgi:phosphate transport system ATP-binding protein